MKEKFKTIGLVVLGCLVLTSSVFTIVTKTNADTEMARLRNEVASRDKTIEVQKGLYSKLSIESDDLQKTLKTQLGGKDEQINQLTAQISKNKEEILAVNQVALKWKKAYEGLADAGQETLPSDPGQPERVKVAFVKEFDFLKVEGYTLINPAEAYVKVTQTKPLKVTVAVTQDKNKQWHGYLTTSDSNTEAEISVSAVNPYVLAPKWYENIGFSATIAGGTTTSGFGALVGVGASYRVKQFEIGPAVFVGINLTPSVYFGGSVLWRPFSNE